ncbi:ChbG/HpnK family deacetylase [Butyrivibrio sp. MC2013]|uniref:ChbG/HpnK family deacetylase n=1 Tax=Butyrivibrio sp. MC2013 TaxID=1280686 RepID=UPI00047C6013|nr:ChbG/HpnK family deacetylase [Butyrivibrio sp. MC2013]
MFIFHADDYGINIQQSKRILACREDGCLNSVSIIPNGEQLPETMELLDDGCLKGIHLNFCEGKALSEPGSVPLLTDEKGVFNRSFVNLLICSFTHPKELEAQVAEECYLQMRRILSFMPEGYKLRIDSHRHYHMIPGVTKGIVRAIDRIGVPVEYYRLPIEDFGLYIKEPRLWKNISPLSVVKAMILKACLIIDKPLLKRKGLYDKSLKYIGVIFTDRMFYSNIAPLIRRIKRTKSYQGRDVEIQFHPGAIYDGEYLLDDTFKDWFASYNRKGEATALLRLKTSSMI